MKYERFLPVLIIAVILGALVYAQGWLGNQSAPEPETNEEIRLQAAQANNKLEDIVWFDVEIELMNDAEIEVSTAQVKAGTQGASDEVTNQIIQKLQVKTLSIKWKYRSSDSSQPVMNR